MKTAISVDDELIAAADRLARREGLSRSGLFSQALKEYLARRRGEEMTAQLNRVYATADPSEQRIGARMKTKFRKTIESRW